MTPSEFKRLSDELADIKRLVLRLTATMMPDEIEPTSFDAVELQISDGADPIDALREAGIVVSARRAKGRRQEARR